MDKKWIGTTFWGTSVAMSWMWGLGLFFSVQFTYQYGLTGLLSFAIPNALGLILFGLFTHMIAMRNEGRESLDNFFTNWSRPYRLVFFLYQLLAITLTIFAIIRYLWQPLGLQPNALYLPLTILIVLSAGILFGEEFNITRIKYSHAALFCIMVVAMGVVLVGVQIPLIPLEAPKGVDEITYDINFWGYWIPICIGFLLGPWLDLQQWQRAIQMHRENYSVAASYTVGGTMFFLMLIFHGGLALWAMRHAQNADAYVTLGRFDEMTYAQGMLTGLFYQHSGTLPWLFGAYVVFICICILTTLDSGYISLRWFLHQNARRSNSAILSLVPERLITSPIPSFVLAGVFSLCAVLIGLELEYFMIFYATFFVGYAALGVTRCFSPLPQGTLAMPQIKMFCVGSSAVVLFSFGYFLHRPEFQILGSVLPLGYVIWLLVNPETPDTLGEPGFSVREAEKKDETVLDSPSASPAAVQAGEGVGTKAVDAGASCYIEDKWFVYTFITTYSDTNSVGNVYFGMYAMWVGKTRELFFNHVLPKFDLKDTEYYILTRSFEHKFLQEAKEFEKVKVKIRVAKYNRKFATLEHEVFDSKNKVLGRGEQSLMFVSSKDYALIDIPQDVTKAFIPYT